MPEFRCGDIVALKSKPNRTGRVVAVWFTVTIKVQWADDKSKSEHNHTELVKLKK